MAVQQRPTWLNQLPSHSIFELDEQEYLEWSRINSRDNTKSSTPSASSLSAPRLGTGQRASFGLEDLQEEYQRANQGLSCMTVHRQDMYVAVGRQIRYANLSDLKGNVENNGRAAAAEYIEGKQHKILKIENIDFDIRRLITNQDGKLLAVVGDEKVVVVVLPKAIRQDAKAVQCRSFVVGEFYHINKGPSKIVKVLWHPLSRGCTHLLVMTHDSTLRMYDVGEDFDEPEQVLSFAGKWQKSSTYGLDVDHAASFCFGSKHSPWGQLAIYCLTQNGDVYMMCPIMPQNCVLKIENLETIREQVEGKIRPSRTRSKLEDLEQKWLEDLLQSMESHPFSDEVVIVRNPDLGNAKVARQGPFLYQPAPIEPDDDDNRAYDILALETEAVGVLVLAYSCGKVDICLTVDPPSSRWALLSTATRKSGTYTLDDDDNDGDDDGQNEDEDHLPTLSVYETVDLGILRIFGTTSSSRTGGYSLMESRMSIPNHPVLVADSMYNDIFYVYHDTGAHYVLIKPWLDELTGIYEAASQGVSGLDNRIAKFYNSKVKSTVGCIVTTRPTKSSPPAPIVGFSVVTDAYLEYSLVLLTASLQVIGQELLTRPKATDAAIQYRPAQPSLTGSKEKDKEFYHCALSLPAFGSQDGLVALSGLPLQPKVVLPPGVASAKIVVTEENLQFLNKVARGVRESLRDVYTACDVAQQRLVAQEEEYRRQQKEVDKANERIKASIQKKIQAQVTRQENQAELHKKLMTRVDELLRKLTEARGPELSSAEKAWALEVAKSERVVRTFDERRHKVQTQYEILKRRMLEMQSSLIGNGNEVSGVVIKKQSVAGVGERSTSRSGHQPVVYERQPVRRYGTSQLQTVESALSVEAQLLDTTMKMVTNVTSRLEVVDISKD